MTNTYPGGFIYFCLEASKDLAVTTHREISDPEKYMKIRRDSSQSAVVVNMGLCESSFPGLPAEQASCIVRERRDLCVPIRHQAVTTPPTENPRVHSVFKVGCYRTICFHNQKLTEQIQNISVYMFTCAAIGICSGLEGVPQVPYAFCNIFKFIAVFQMTGNSGLPSSWEIFIHRQVKNP